MQKRLKVYKGKKYIYMICIIHFIISCIYSHKFFAPLRENVGSENIAYQFFETGTLLQNDSLSRNLCWIYAHLLAVLFIFIFWNWVFFIIRMWKTQVIERKYILILLLSIIIGVFTIAAVYPITITSAPDTPYNYVYAKEWLPMYWHGFLTNVVHCACLLTFSHPIFMSVIPFFFGINIIFYFTYHTVVKYSKEHKIIKALVWGIILLLMPETFQLLTYVGRNYMYAILSVSVIGTFLKDYLEKEKLSRKKFLILTFLVICLSVWRSEGFLYLIFYPFFLYFTYFYGGKEVFSKKKFLKGVIYTGLFYLIMSLPGKYGSEKYQGYDYFIINTPGPLSAILVNENSNFSYKDADKDLEKINDIVPLEYIKKYGEDATCYYNWDNFRLSRQCDAGNGGKGYVIASYKILLYNWPIYFKYQANLFARSIGLPEIFVLTNINTEDWIRTQSKEVKAWFNWVMDYYSIGTNNMSENYNIIFFNERFDTLLNKIAFWGITKLHGFGRRFSGVVKIFVTLLVLIISIISWRKKQWIYTILGIFMLGILAVIVLMAPAARDNYYYSIYFNQYWFLLFAWFQAKGTGIKIT